MATLVNEANSLIAGFRFTNFPKRRNNISSAVLAYTLEGVVAAQLPTILSLYIVADEDPPVFDGGNTPPLLSEITATSDFLMEKRTFNEEGTVIITVDCPPTLVNAAINTTSRFAADSSTKFGPGLDDPVTPLGWQGTVAFHVHAHTADKTNLTIIDNSSCLNMVGVNTDFTGIDVFSNKGTSSRADQCPICGDETLRETWVFSGYHNRMVCPKCHDPADVQYEVPLTDRPLTGEDI